MGQHIILIVTFLLVNIVNANLECSECEVLARTESGWVCGTKRLDWQNQVYASFLGIPYARPPLGALRFQELQPAEPWDGTYDASTEGPVCPNNQADLIFGALIKPHGVSEACIHANVYVPIAALPDPSAEVVHIGGGLPIVVVIHCGSWSAGSGDPDLFGPERIVSKGAIVITFNYRLDVIGFLSRGTSKVPGNSGLRDAVTLLRWVQANARHFGGNPDDVTLFGQSAGAASVHLLSVSPAAKGLFKRIWLMSGAAVQSFYTASPVYAKQVSDKLLSYLDITCTDEDEIHDLLIQVPIDKLIEASGKVLKQEGITSFVPVVETPYPGITTILSEDPEVLLARGEGNDIPMVIGFTNKECESLRPRLEAGNVVDMYEQNPSISLYRSAVYSLSSDKTAAMVEKMRQRYFCGKPTVDEYIRMCSDSLFAYPALKTARARATSCGAPVSLYKFEYNSAYSAVKRALNLTHDGAGHTEDLTYIFQVNSFAVPENTADEAMRCLMTDLFINYIKYGDPSNGDVFWPPYPQNQYFNIQNAQDSQYVGLSEYDQDLVEFYDNLLAETSEDTTC